MNFRNSTPSGRDWAGIVLSGPGFSVFPCVGFWNRLFIVTIVNREKRNDGKSVGVHIIITKTARGPNRQREGQGMTRPGRTGKYNTRPLWPTWVGLSEIQKSERHDFPVSRLLLWQRPVLIW